MIVEDLPASKIILTGQKSKTLHKEELTMSETERTVKKKIEDNAKLMQNKRRYSGSKSPLSPLTATPANKTSPTSKSVPKTTGPTSKPSSKRIRVTSSDGRTCNLNLDLTVTFSQLQEAIHKELK